MFTFSSCYLKYSGCWQTSIEDVDLEWMVLFIKYLNLKSRTISVGVLKGHHRNDSHYTDLGTF